MGIKSYILLYVLILFILILLESSPSPPIQISPKPIDIPSPKCPELSPLECPEQIPIPPSIPFLHSSSLMEGISHMNKFLGENDRDIHLNITPIEENGFTPKYIVLESQEFHQNPESENLNIQALLLDPILHKYLIIDKEVESHIKGICITICNNNNKLTAAVGYSNGSTTLFHIPLNPNPPPENSNIYIRKLSFERGSREVSGIGYVRGDLLLTGGEGEVGIWSVREALLWLGEGVGGAAQTPTPTPTPRFIGSLVGHASRVFLVHVVEGGEGEYESGEYDEYDEYSESNEYPESTTHNTTVWTGSIEGPVMMWKLPTDILSDTNQPNSPLIKLSPHKTFTYRATESHITPGVIHLFSARMCLMALVRDNHWSIHAYHQYTGDHLWTHAFTLSQGVNLVKAFAFGSGDVVTGSSDGKVVMWTNTTLQDLSRITEWDIRWQGEVVGEVTSLTLLSPQLILAAGADGMKVFDVLTGRLWIHYSGRQVLGFAQFVS